MIRTSFQRLLWSAMRLSPLIYVKIFVGLYCFDSAALGGCVLMVHDIANDERRRTLGGFCKCGLRGAIQISDE
ncbi:hypothetical protein ARD30_08130 [Bosea thiooxidans]|uniref:Uncharacterized protein n=1 Tax=Bosea thiooxidans TaxID=53254 RepID=A0A0Q3IAN0_9HYPH|nr:hypothetical protein ARD30_08130 [Bosea thiooxidans]